MKALYLIFPLFLLTHCKSFVELEPPNNQLVNTSVFSSDATATAAVNGLYSKMMETGLASGGSNSMTVLGGLSSDELTNYSSRAAQRSFAQNSLDPTNNTLNTVWSSQYQVIYSTNAILEGLGKSDNVSTSIKRQLTGEAKFVRAFCYFYLVNIFGDVPLHLSTDYSVNSKASRSSKEAVYEQIVVDLMDSASLLSEDFSSSNEQRTRPNKYAAISLLARVFLFNKDWNRAEQLSTSVIDQSAFQLESECENVFVNTSRETIWQLMPTRTDINTNEGALFILLAPPSSVALNVSIIGAFEDGDKRSSAWVGKLEEGGEVWYFPFKYKIKSGGPLVEYSVVLRLSELYLIRAEARSHLNMIEESKSDLNMLRRRAGLSETLSNDKQSLLIAIERERRVELFAEWGHRWLDLKRWPALAGAGFSRADEVLAQLKADTWQATDTLYPIPLSERISNSNITQNPGY